jgi:hypothetical protein
LPPEEGNPYAFTGLLADDGEHRVDAIERAHHLVKATVEQALGVLALHQ